MQIRPTNIDSDGNLKFEKNIFIDNPSQVDILMNNEVLFNNTNSQELVGKTGVFKEYGNYCCSNHITRLMPCDSVLPVYLKEILNFYFQSKIFYYLCTNWNNQSGINYSVLKNILIPIPSKEIQQKIVDIMENAYNTKKQLEDKAGSLLDSINNYLLDELGIVMPAERENMLINRMFFVKSNDVINNRFDPRKYAKKYHQIFNAIKNSPCDKRSLQDVIVDHVSGNWGLDEIEEDEDLVRCLTIRATEFDNKYNLNLDNNRTKYRKYKPLTYDKIALNSKDILIEKSGGSEDQPVGRVAFIDDEIILNRKLAFSNFIHKIVINADIASPEYVFEYLRLMHNIKVTEVMQTQTNGIRNLIMSEYFRQTILLPDKNIQKFIAKQASSMRKTAQKLEVQADEVIAKAKAQVEKILLGGCL